VSGTGCDTARDAGKCSVNYPGPTGLGATFNRSLWHATGALRAEGSRVFLTPLSIFVPPSIRFLWCHLAATYRIHHRFDPLDPAERRHAKGDAMGDEIRAFNNLRWYRYHMTMTMMLMMVLLLCLEENTAAVPGTA
jgi:hypothetical protein